MSIFEHSVTKTSERTSCRGCPAVTKLGFCAIETMGAAHEARDSALRDLEGLDADAAAQATVAIETKWDAAEATASQFMDQADALQVNCPGTDAARACQSPSLEAQPLH